jgi:hypothetical protein
MLLQERPIDRNDGQPKTRRRDKWLVLLLLVTYLFPIGGGLILGVLYQRGEPIGTAGYVILAVMFLPLLATLLTGLALGKWQPSLDVDCTWCGREFYSTDLPTLLQTGRCPGCGQAVPADDLQDLE